MNILIINAGSSSIKYSLFENKKLLINGLEERVKDYKKILKKIIKQLAAQNYTIDAIGHRVVHGGKITKSKRITKKLVKQLDKIKELAPLHDIPEINCIKFCLENFKVPQIAIFDTSFHSTIPDYAYTYAIPQKISKKLGIRRYGFHGMSHKYVSLHAANVLKKPLSKLKLITCHLGNGASITAINRGKSIDTSMGFTPLEGLVMGTRSGDLDPAIIPFLQKQKNSIINLNLNKTELFLNKKCGLKGICGMNDMRDIYNSKSKDAKLAIEVFCYRLKKYIGSYMAALNGVDAIIFTGGIGENAEWIREKTLKNMDFFGINLDKKKNKISKAAMQGPLVISKNNSKIKILVVKTNEELMMCEEVISIVSR
ncbi:acetate/propionate family kinase [Candidatus Woesearchaeota archaeon]|jgi:acetate kinase|nr:acetate/propionate family kinase [Candidatus Woesearchaeota archaeon]MBT6520377.1 acetate/propionate family kinase [Candidatus Woesearchaeota archaeon]MBT7368541.1 acetate/propionate family kinase [Candidatus Woesearchaeota archaeon]